MHDFKIFCLSIYNDIYDEIKNLNYIPVGLGENSFSNDWLRDNTGDNISIKNKFYGEYTFHYWFWKNYINKIPENCWIGFCAYRRFWLNENLKEFNKSNKPTQNFLQQIPSNWNEYDVILGNDQNLSNISWMKVLKYGKISLIRNPEAIYKKRKRNIRFHFDMHHGNGILDTAINLLDENNRNDFKEFTVEKNSYNQGNMFVTKSKELIIEFYKDIFSWLEKCEKKFGFNLSGYGKIRLYAFLAERFLPFWFNKNSKVLKWPVIYYDLRNNLNEKK
tara:strand:- start:812 stop:1639 length:828 start_codon:yes stop_codon:yes gene_type:complete